MKSVYANNHKYVYVCVYIYIHIYYLIKLAYWKVCKLGFNQKKRSASPKQIENTYFHM